MSSPRSASAANVGARPASIARRSIAGCIASTTTRASFLLTAAARTLLAQDPKTLVLSALATPARNREIDQRSQGDERDRRQQQAEKGDRVGVEYHERRDRS